MPPPEALYDLKCRFQGRFCSFSLVFGQKLTKSARNRLLLKGLLRVLGGAGEGLWLEVRSQPSGKRKTYTGTSPLLFSKKAMQWGKKWPVQMNLPFFAVEAYVPGGVQNQAEKKIRKNAFWPVPVQKFTFPDSSNLL